MYRVIAPYKDGSNWIEHEHFTYRRREQRRGTERYVCSQAGCPALVRIRNGVVAAGVTQHIHGPMPWIEERNKMYHALRQRVTADWHTSLKDIQGVPETDDNPLTGYRAANLI